MHLLLFVYNIASTLVILLCILGYSCVKLYPLARVELCEQSVRTTEAAEHLEWFPYREAHNGVQFHPGR